MSDTAAVPLGTRIKFLVIGLVAGAALAYGLRPTAPGNVPSQAANTPSVAGGPAPAGKPDQPSPTAVGLSNAGAAPVAVVDGRAITLREVENSLLKQEGVQQLLTMVEGEFKRMNWDRLGDRDILVQTNTWRVNRVSVAAQLLKQKASDAREDLIGIALVRDALKKEGVVVNDALVANEIRRMEKRHYEGLEARKQPYMEFRTFIEETQKISFEEYTAQEGFRMGAGIRALVERRAAAELKDERLQEWFAKHSDRYRVQAAVDISSIFLPYLTIKSLDGKVLVTQEEKDQRMSVMINLHQAVYKKQMSFERTFQAFARSSEQNADAGGRLGWVNRDGSRPIKGARRISQRAMDEAFAAQSPYPVLLSPVASELGIELLLVHGRRAGKEPVFAELRTQLVADVVDGELAARTKRVLDDLRRSAVIDYRSLPALIEQRVSDAGLPAVLPGEVSPVAPPDAPFEVPAVAPAP